MPLKSVLVVDTLSILWYSVQLNIIMLELSTERSNVEGWTRVGARLSRVLSDADKTIQPLVFCTEEEEEFNAKFHIVVRKDDDTETLVSDQWWSVQCPVTHPSVDSFLRRAIILLWGSLSRELASPCSRVVGWSPEGIIDNGREKSYANIYVLSTVKDFCDLMFWKKYIKAGE